MQLKAMMTRDQMKAFVSLHKDKRMIVSSHNPSVEVLLDTMDASVISDARQKGFTNA